MKLFGRKPVSRRSWIAVTAADARAKPGGRDATGGQKAMPQGTILTAGLAEDGGGHWRIKDAEVAGKVLPSTAKVLEKTEWALLPEAAQVPPAGLALDKAAIGGRRWSFAVGAPFVLDADGWIGGVEPLQGWALRQGVLYLFGTGGRTAWMSTRFVTVDGAARIEGLNFGNPDAAQPSVLHEVRAPEAEAEPTPPVEHDEPKALPAPGIRREPEAPAPAEMVTETAPAEAVEDAPAREAPADEAAPPDRRTLCLRGMRPLLPHLKPAFAVTVEGLSSNRKWNFSPVARAAMVYDEAMSDRGRVLLGNLPGVTPEHFASRITTLTTDIYVLSFHTEGAFGTYRSRSTGMILPIQSTVAGNADFKTIPYRQVAKKAEAVGLTEADWTFLREEFDYIEPFDEAQLEIDIDRVFTAVRDRRVIVPMLSTAIGQNNALLRRFARVNEVVRPLAERHGVSMIDTGDFVKTDDDLDPTNRNGAVFKPRIYKQIAEKVIELIGPK